MAPSLSPADPEGPTSTVHLAQSPEVVFAVLVDPTTYPDWLVGAQAIRAVDPDWPAKGSAFHHRVGVGPLRLADRTTVVDEQAPERLELLARVGPVLKARVIFELEPAGGGTRLSIREHPERGVLAVLWRTIGRSLLSVGLWGRNGLSLERLRSYLDEHAPVQPAEPVPARDQPDAG